jgi:hypothetical protein
MTGFAGQPFDEVAADYDEDGRHEAIARALVGLADPVPVPPERALRRARPAGAGIRERRSGTGNPRRIRRGRRHGAAERHPDGGP